MDPKAVAYIIIDGGYSLGQVLRFASQNNAGVLHNHYLSNISTVDGAATYLGMQRRTDLAEDFLSATMRWNPGVSHTLPAREEEELKKSDEYVSLEEKIEKLRRDIESTTSRETLSELKMQRTALYSQRRQLEKTALDEYQGSQKIVYEAPEVHEQVDWRHEHFDRIFHVLHPARRLLSQIMGLRAAPRSPAWVDALKALVALRTSDCSVAYQDALRPIDGKCPVPTCRRDMER